MILKHAKDALKTFEKTLLYSTGQERRMNNANAAIAANRTDETLYDKISKFGDLISLKNAYIIPLRVVTDTGHVNHPTKLYTKIICTPETDLKLFQSNKQVAAVTAFNA